MTTAYFGLGSNVDAERNIRAAVRELEVAFGHLVLSPIYRSRAVGFQGDDFINLVAAADTDREPMEVRDLLRAIEDRHGRRRDVPKFSDRTLDIDILLFGDRVSPDPELVLPRPEILRFVHVLRPLADLAPDLVLPGDGRSLSDIRAEAGLDESGLQGIADDFLRAAG